MSWTDLANASLPGKFLSGLHLLRSFRFKEVIQPQVPLRLPCYDFVPVMNHTVVTVFPKVRLATSGVIHDWVVSRQFTRDAVE